MMIKKAVVSAALAIGLASGTVLAASPAQAASYGMTYPSQAHCMGGTAASFGNYVAKGYKVKIKEHCNYHKIGKNPAYWYSLIEYTR